MENIYEVAGEAYMRTGASLNTAGITKAVDAITPLIQEPLLDVLADVIKQACSAPGDRWESVDSMALSAYADGIDVLAKHGRVVVTHTAGRRRVALWVRDE